jgi:uncharacterized small protein (DUF1192 family)
MDPDDLDPRRPATGPKALDAMGVAELEAYIAGLEAEIARARAAIDARQQHRSAADLLFKSGD